MRRIAIIVLLASTTLLSCSNQTFTCTCNDKGADDTEIDSYPISAKDKATAAFECGQKNIKYSSNPAYQEVKCKIDEP